MSSYQKKKKKPPTNDGRDFHYCTRCLPQKYNRFSSLVYGLRSHFLSKHLQKNGYSSINFGSDVHMKKRSRKVFIITDWSKDINRLLLRFRQSSKTAKVLKSDTYLVEGVTVGVQQHEQQIRRCLLRWKAPVGTVSTNRTDLGNKKNLWVSTHLTVHCHPWSKFAPNSTWKKKNNRNHVCDFPQRTKIT